LVPEMPSQPISFFPSADGSRAALLSVDVSCPEADTLVVTPAGEADISTVPGLRQALREAADAGRSRVIVVLDQLTFLDASTLGVLVDARQRISAAGGTLLVRCRTRRSRQLLVITGLGDMLDPA
jgi:anti-sigma B factor antagonist